MVCVIFYDIHLPEEKILVSSKYLLFSHSLYLIVIGDSEFQRLGLILSFVFSSDSLLPGM